jgi:hypothetical protein
VEDHGGNREASHAHISMCYTITMVEESLPEILPCSFSASRENEEHSTATHKRYVRAPLTHAIGCKDKI